MAKAKSLREAGDVPNYFLISESIISIYGSDEEKETRELVDEVKKELENAKKLFKGRP
jgi:hypothetical protein